MSKVRMSPSASPGQRPSEDKSIGDYTGSERPGNQPFGSHAEAGKETDVSRQARQPSQKEAGTILGLGVRPIKRLLKVCRQKGAAGLISKQRGRASNNRLSEGTRQKALDLLQTKYRGFGPTLAHEKLVEKERLQLSKESVRYLMIAEGLWQARKVKKEVGERESLPLQRGRQGLFQAAE
jgi:transposase